MEKRTYLNEIHGIDGEVSFEFDVASGRIHVIGTGFWSVNQTRAYLQDLRLVLRRIHAAGLNLSALVDMSGTRVQQAEVAEVTATMTRGIYRPGDAVAILMADSLTKMQGRRILDSDVHEFFVSRHAAETWLAGKRDIAGVRDR
jgi:hypothetical protein